MNTNPDKCHIVVSKNGNFVPNIDESKIYNTKTE